MCGSNGRVATLGYQRLFRPWSGLVCSDPGSGPLSGNVRFPSDFVRFTPQLRTFCGSPDRLVLT